MFSTAPTFPFVAAIVSGYKVLSTKDQVCGFLSFPTFCFLLLSKTPLDSGLKTDF